MKSYNSKSNTKIENMFFFTKYLSVFNINYN